MTDPWSEIERPRRGDELSVRRFSAKAFWDWFIARDERGRYLILLSLRTDPSSASFPVIQGLEVRTLQDHKGRYRIEIALNDSEAIRPFQHICEDLVDVSEQVASDENLPRCVADRLETWKRLWRKQLTGLLSEEEQKGLVAELLFMRDFWLETPDEVAALSGWVGPDGASQDFRHGFRAVEVKSRPPSRNSFVVSSVDQLWFDGELFVAIYPVATVGGLEGSPFSLNGLVGEVRNQLTTTAGKDRLEVHLINCGYIDRREYDEERFVVAEPSFYRVEDGFPRLIEHQVQAGVEDIRYSVNLHWCEDYRLERDEFKEAQNGRN